MPIILRQLATCAIAISIILLVILSSRYPPFARNTESIHRFGTEKKVLVDVSRTYNETLGFGRIYCINMPHRTDRRDALHLMSILSGITIEFVDGVYGDKIDNRALIGHPDRNMPEGEKDGVWGCWRSHMDTILKFLDSGLETALILEDDVHWDIHLKETLSIAATKVEELQSEEYNTTIGDPNLPYGKYWDMLYLGSCFEFTPENPSSWPHRIYKDANVPEKEFQGGFYVTLLEQFQAKPSGERLIMKLAHPVCTFGYAITRVGAMRILYHLGMFPLVGPLDVHYGTLQMAGKLKGYSVVPPFLSEWKSGDGTRDSEISPDWIRGNQNIKDSIRDHIPEMLEFQSWG